MIRGNGLSFKIHWAISILKICLRNWPTRYSTLNLYHHSFGSRWSPKFEWLARLTVKQVYRSFLGCRYCERTPMFLGHGVFQYLQVWFLKFGWLYRVDVNSVPTVNSKNLVFSCGIRSVRSGKFRHPSVAIMGRAIPYFLGFLTPLKKHYFVNFRLLA